MATRSGKSPKTIFGDRDAVARLRTFAESVVRLRPSRSAAAFLLPILLNACSRILRSMAPRSVRSPGRGQGPKSPVLAPKAPAGVPSAVEKPAGGGRQRLRLSATAISTAFSNCGWPNCLKPPLPACAPAGHGSKSSATNPRRMRQPPGYGVRLIPRLLDKARECYSKWDRIHGAMSVGYTPDGAPAAAPRPSRICCEG